MTKREVVVNSTLVARATAAGIGDAELQTILGSSLLSVARLLGVMDALATVGAGETAEVGCCAGGTSRLIARLNGKRRHWACDTFSGLVDAKAEDPQFANGEFRSPIEKAREILSSLPMVRIVPGYFPDSAPLEMRGQTFRFVHIDVDTYTSILNCFRFFAPRMTHGGIIAIDDVLERGCVGAQKAWAELEAENTGWEVIGRNPPQVVVRFR